jgi:hypothetical protein
MLRCVNDGVPPQPLNLDIRQLEMCAWYCQVSCPSRCSLCQEEFMFGEDPRKPTIRNAWFLRWNTGGRASVMVWATISWYGILLVPSRGGNRKFPDCYCCNCLSEGNERGDQGHTSASLLHQLPHDTALWTRTVFTWALFRLLVSFRLQWLAISSNVSDSSFAWRSVNPLPKPLKCFTRLLESQRAIFEWHSCFKDGQVSVEDDKL